MRGQTLTGKTSTVGCSLGWDKINQFATLLGAVAASGIPSSKLLRFGQDSFYSHNAQWVNLRTRYTAPTQNASRLTQTPMRAQSGFIVDQLEREGFQEAWAPEAVQ